MMTDIAKEAAPLRGVESQAPDSLVVPVRLPAQDLRQPSLAVNAETQSPVPPASTSYQNIPEIEVKQSGGSGREEIAQLIKRANQRGTRGRGDPRNESMKRARECYRREQLAKHHQQPKQQEYILQISPPTRDMAKIGLAVTLHGRGEVKFSPNTSCEDGRGFMQTPSRSSHHSPLPRQPPSQRRTQPHRHLIPIHGPPSSLGRHNNIFMRPPPTASRGEPQHQHQIAGPLVRRYNDWTTWVELGVKVYGLPSNVTTRDLWTNFSREGSIATIQLFEDFKGNRDGKAQIRFR